MLPRETLAEMITAQEEKLTELENLCEAASEELEKTAELMDKVSRLYDELISYADLYDSANFEAKKMIVNQLIRRVDVYRGCLMLKFSASTMARFILVSMKIRTATLSPKHL